MDITPQFLKDIKLSDAFRGYNKDEVDELIERMGAAFGQLQARLREAVDRAELAESRSVVGGRSESEETLRRTLVLAQRTADAAIAEANAEAAATIAAANERAARTIATADEHAERTVGDARSEAGRAVSEANEIASRTVRDAEERATRTITEASDRAQQLLADSESHAANLRAETDAEVRRIAEESRGPLMEQIRELERVRNFLRDDVDLLEGHLHAQRERLRLQVAELARIVDEPSTLRVEPTPETSGVDAAEVLAQPAFVPASSSPEPPSVASGVTEAPSAPGASAPAGEPTRWEPALHIDAPPPPPPGVVYGAAAAGAGAAAAAAVQVPSATSVVSSPDDELDDELYDDAEDAYDELETAGELDEESYDDEFAYDDEHDGGTGERSPIDLSWAGDRVDPYAQQFEDLASDDEGMVHAELEGGGDQFLAHLRRAVEDDVADDDGAMSAFFNDEVEEAPRSRFGFRR